MKLNYKLHAKDQLTSLIKDKGITTWNELTLHIQYLPYGRNANRTDFSLVLIEEKGSCSSKHAFLKHVADLNNLPDIKLILGMYKMNSMNTPKIGNVLIENKIDYIPEAHCYLSVEGERVDLTSRNSDFKKIKDAILLEQEIEASQVAEFKVDFHKTFIKNWIETDNIPFAFDKIWKVREACINNLSL